jgi:hypothetical protein
MKETHHTNQIPQNCEHRIDMRKLYNICSSK